MIAKRFVPAKNNKPGPAQVGAISNAQRVKVFSSKAPEKIS